MTTTIIESFARSRLFWSRLFGVALLAVVVFSPLPWPENSLMALAFEVSGFVLLATATLLRLWCTTYIAGLKNNVLMQEGPYSMVRNPLYVSSFIGGIGFGLSVENPILTAVIAMAFLIYYPWVVRHEEERLAGLFGEAYLAYCRKVPRWFPRFSSYSEPETYTVRARMLRRGYFNAMWFMWAFLLWEVIERLREIGIVPALWGGSG